MEEQLVKSDGLIVVKQLPIIEDRLDEAYALVQERLGAVASLVVTEDNYRSSRRQGQTSIKSLGIWKIFGRRSRRR